MCISYKVSLCEGDMFNSFFSDGRPEDYAISVFGTISILSLVLFMFGLIQNRPTIILGINFVLKVCISIYLIYKYNQFQKNNLQFTNLDRKLVFSLSVYNLVVSFSDIALIYIDDIREFFINNFTSKIDPHLYINNTMFSSS